MKASRAKCFRLPLAGAVGLLLSLALVGCSSFNRDWKKPDATPPSADNIEGRWEGSWLSGVKGHHGSLRCLITRIDDTQYRARYKATYWKIFRIGYTVEMKVEREPDGAFKMRGENDLGWWGGGAYHYEGEASGTNFSATYQSKYDHGTFEMKRPAP